MTVIPLTLANLALMDLSLNRLTLEEARSLSVWKFAVMERGSRINVMTETITMEMDAPRNAKLTKDGLALVDPASEETLVLN